MTQEQAQQGMQTQTQHQSLIVGQPSPAHQEILNSLFGRKTKDGTPVLDKLRGIIKQFGPTLVGVVTTAIAGGALGGTTTTPATPGTTPTGGTPATPGLGIDWTKLIAGVLTGIMNQPHTTATVTSNQQYLQVGPGSFIGTLVKMAAEVLLTLEDAGATEAEKIHALTAVLNNVYAAEIVPLLGKLNPITAQFLNALANQLLPTIAAALYTAVAGVISAIEKNTSNTNAGTAVPAAPPAQGTQANPNTTGTVTQQ